MTERQGASDKGLTPASATPDMPTADVAAFIRYCHRRRGLKWPELYDEMCGVAARREFNGWDHADLASRGVTFSLLEMPRLAAWARAVLAREELVPVGSVPNGTPALEAALA